MPTQDQLEIISPDGQIEFHLLDPGKGVTNIGRHPDNDLVLDSPQVASFQAVLDHQQRPYRIMTLTAEGEVLLSGERLAPNHFHVVQDWDTLEFDGFVLVLLEAGEDQAPGEQRRVAVQPTPARPLVKAVEPAGPVEPVAPAGPAAAAEFSVRPPDLLDDVIIVEMPEREWVTDVDQAFSFAVTVINGGSLVASFDIQVEGLDESWVSIAPAKLNLNEGARGAATVYIQAPRLPTSRAGLHHLSVVVTSPNYPERISRLGGTVTLNPFYEYAVGDLSPKQQTISWRKRTGQVTLPITNRGNSTEAFRLSAEDDERGCQFEFDLPEEGARLVKQAEFRLDPLESRAVPVCVTPMRRRLVAFRKHTYAFTITTTQVEGIQSPRMVMGQAKSAPLIGPLLLLLIAIGLFALVVFFTRPVRVPLLTYDPTMQDSGTNVAPSSSLPVDMQAASAQVIATASAGQGSSQVWLVQGDSATIMPDQPVTFRYSGARFQGFSPRNILNRLNGLFLELRLEYQASNGDWRTVVTPPEFEALDGTVTVVPPANGRYRLRADTWVSNLVPMLGGTSREISVFVTPVQPKIVYFRATPEQPLIGSEVTISWRVEGAEALTLSYEGVEETLQDQELETGSRTQVLNADTVFTLVASNRFNPDGVKEPLTVAVLVPTPTPIPTPVIERFNVDPLEITEGDTVRLSWQVTGADTVSIDPLGDEFLLQGDIGDQPTSLTTYRLTARKIAADGTEAKNSVSAQVFVNPPPTPTPEPKAPDVQVFDATPKEIVAGDDTDVTLTWSVSGTTTDIQLTGGSIPLTGLDPQGSLSLTISDGVIFVLTAYNGELSSSKHVQISTVDATPVPPAAPVIEDFSAEVETGKLVSYDPDTEVYKILEDANVILKWVVSGEEVEIQLDGKRVSGEEKDMGPIDADVDYQLLATNEGGDDVRDLYIRVVARDIPAPEAFSYDPATRTFSWRYGRPDDIEGFRLYKTPGARILVAATAGLPGSTGLPELPAPVPGDDAYVYTWVLPTGECGTFFLVAVYKDPYDGNTFKETDAAADSWGVPCP